MEMNLEAGVIVSGVVQSFNLDTLRVRVDYAAPTDTAA